MRYSPKRDKNERLLIDCLKQYGCSVVQLDGSGVPDLAVGIAGFTFLLEVKSKTGRLTEQQVSFFDAWNGHARTVRTIEDIKDFLDNIILINRYKCNKCNKSFLVQQYYRDRERTFACPNCSNGLTYNKMIGITKWLSI